MSVLTDHAKAILTCLMGVAMLLDEHFQLKLFGSEDAMEAVTGFLGTVLVWFTPGK